MLKVNPNMGGVISTKSHKKHLKNKIAHPAVDQEAKESAEMNESLPGQEPNETRRHHDERSVANKETTTYKSKPAKTGTGPAIWQVTTIALAVLLIASIFTHGFSDISINIDKEGKTNNKLTGQLTSAVSDKLAVELYVMSQCPYGVQAEDTLFPAVQELGEENFDLQVDYISTDLGNGAFQSLHGQPETDGNIVQLCARDVDASKYLDFVLCMNKDASAIPNNWEACAQSLDYDVEAVRTCYQGDKGKELLSESAANSVNAGASGSPTIIVNNQPYTGGREINDFKRAFCAAFGNDKPTACDDLPPVKEFEMIVLNDEKCNSCDTSGIVGATTGYFPGATIRTVDVSSTEGKALVKKYNVDIVPTYIFAPGVTETQVWQDVQFQTSFEALDDGSYKLLDSITGATWFIDEEKQKARLSEMGIVSGDNKPQIDFFLMSYCPHGNQAEEAMIGAYELLKDDAEFFPHYIYYENYQGGGPNYCLDEENKYCSMHGVVEARQNVREQCVQEKYGLDAWFEFVIEMNSACTSQNADECYVAIAEDLGYDVDYIANCEEERAIEFAAEDARLMKLFGASGSPGVYIDGISFSGSRSASGYQAGLCAAFDDAPTACDNVVVVNDAPAVEGSC
ncbi:GILT family protein [Candidatus Woesearchaeota archaeon]|nr:GILT family protein [Candidatus Woesearchaeota archaeon]